MQLPNVAPIEYLYVYVSCWPARRTGWNLEAVQDTVVFVIGS